MTGQVYWAMRGELGAPPSAHVALDECPICLRELGTFSNPFERCPRCKVRLRLASGREIPERERRIA